MSFQKAQDLLKLAHIAASRHRGITVKEIATEFKVNERTAVVRHGAPQPTTYCSIMGGAFFMRNAFEFRPSCSQKRVCSSV